MGVKCYHAGIILLPLSTGINDFIIMKAKGESGQLCFSITAVEKSRKIRILFIMKNRFLIPISSKDFDVVHIAMEPNYDRPACVSFGTCSVLTV